MWRWMGHNTLTLNLFKSLFTDSHVGASCGKRVNKAKPQKKSRLFSEMNNDGFCSNQLYNGTFDQFIIK